MGYVAMGCSSLHLIVNMTFIITESGHQICLRFTKWRLMRKYAKVRGEQLLKREKKARELKFKKSSKSSAQAKLKRMTNTN